MNLLTHLLIYNLIISFLLYASLAYNPRIWMHRMPPEVVQKVPPRTPAEKRQLYFFGVPFLLILVIYPIGYVLSQDVGFLDRFLIFGAFFAGFAIWDTLVLDLLIFCKLTPRFIIIPGTTCKDYANTKYHLVSGAKGLVMSIVFSAVLAAFL
jgi:hypothetical protein